MFYIHVMIETSSMYWDWINWGYYFLPFIIGKETYVYVRSLFYSDYFFEIITTLGILFMSKFIAFAFYYFLYVTSVANIYYINSIKVTIKDVYKPIKNLGKGVFLLYIPIFSIGYGKVDTSIEGYPTCLHNFMKIMLSLFIFDMCYYVTHRLLHTPYLYKYHKPHHEYVKPIAFADTYGSVKEEYIVTVVTGIVLENVVSMHIVTRWMYIVVLSWHSISQHSNFNLPYSPFRLIPSVNNDVAHVKHHNLTHYNFGAITTIWDRIFQTYHS
jgi:sterol desaturase/sphingolipid hydroxylase (fatty acid hydroxylase superfamily)